MNKLGTNRETCLKYEQNIETIRIPQIENQFINESTSPININNNKNDHNALVSINIESDHTIQSFIDEDYIYITSIKADKQSSIKLPFSKGSSVKGPFLFQETLLQEQQQSFNQPSKHIITVVFTLNNNIALFNWASNQTPRINNFKLFPISLGQDLERIVCLSTFQFLLSTASSLLHYLSIESKSKLPFKQR